MADTWEEKREILKRWYLDNDKSNIDFMRDVMEYRRLNGLVEVRDALVAMYDEHVALGNIKAN